MEQIELSLKSLTRISSSLQREDWEAEVSCLKRFVRLTEENRGLFFALLGKESDLDTYAISPVYYALTGRRGLWVYQDENSYVPLCWHPNVDGQILIFPPRGKYNPSILKRVLTDLPVPPAGIRFARIKKDDIGSQSLLNVVGTLGRSISMSLVEEEPILDWKYPVRILSTERVAKAEGHVYKKTRNCMRQVEKHEACVFPLSVARGSQIMDFVYRWANERTRDPLSIKELVSPYIETTKLLRDDVFNIDGQMYSIDGNIQAVTMWEMPNTSMKIANVWMNLCNTEIRGLSEFVMKTTSETLLARGVPYVNYGGSETKGLDNYKKKFVPAYSVDLKSIEVNIKGMDIVLHSLLDIQRMRLAA